MLEQRYDGKRLKLTCIGMNKFCHQSEFFAVYGYRILG